ncbi:hypothetical protein [Zophobihabitans entericus]|uniref:Uncharacterized protein n=1 Tax=Zophobihabitans entericus TaxID=1635327 RepID=A0A6G9I7S5_9GAMM|nr:hypothetical protein [Zophobihabitans entericus]QIQ20256.1 hypothetical protein IPMB12_00305 [Zophobihabitans entericus]
MAKQIKVIKCPNCGSVQKTEIKEDHYRCDNCNTDYFLDNDDINININQSETKKHTIASNSTAKTIGIAVGAAVIALIVVFAFLPSKPTRTTVTVVTPTVRTTTPPTQTTQTPSTTPQQVKPPVIKYSTTYPYCDTVIDGDRVYMLAIEQRSAYEWKEDKYYFMIYDLLNEKVIKENPISDVFADKNRQVKWQYLNYTSDKTYFTLNDREVYLLDKVNYSFNKVTSTLLAKHPEYQTGIASVTTSITTSGNALHILTNDGKKAYYYPAIDQIYADNYDFHMLKNRPPKPQPDTAEHIYYAFANNYGRNNKLIQSTYVSPDGKNHFEYRSSEVGAQKLGDYPPSVVHQDEDSAYDIIPDTNLDTRIINHKNLTPGRLYFDPSVIYFDDNHLIIKTKINAAPDATYNYQSIDTKTGNVLWTITDDKITIQSVVPFDGNFIAKQSCNKYSIIGADGQIIKQITLKGN